jgi:hypothetical protein
MRENLPHWSDKIDKHDNNGDDNGNSDNIIIINNNNSFLSLIN